MSFPVDEPVSIFFDQRFEIDAARPELGCEIYEITETATQSVQEQINACQ
jgi:hypothetical protein